MLLPSVVLLVVARSQVRARPDCLICGCSDLDEKQTAF